MYISDSDVLNRLPVLFFIKDKDNTIIKVNDRLAASLNKTKEELEGASCFEIFPFELADTYWKDDLEVIEKGVSKENIIEQMPDSFGKLRWFKTEKHPYVDEKGNIVGVMGFSFDIDEQKKTYDKMLRLRTAIEHSPSIVTITDLDGTITYVNPRFSIVTGYHYSEVVGQNIRMLRSGKTLTKTYYDMWTTITKGDVWRGDFLNRTKSGALYWEVASIAPVKDDSGKIINYIKVAEAASDLAQTVTNVWSILEFAHYYVVVLDKTMLIRYCNTNLAKFLGYADGKDIVGKDWRDFLPPKSVSPLEYVHKQLIRSSGGTHTEFVNEIQSKTGERKLVKWFNSAINEGRDLTCSLGIPYSEKDELVDSVESIREYYINILAKDRSMINAVRDMVIDKADKDVDE